MPPFTNSLQAHRVSHELLQTIRLLGEFKGRQALFRSQSPQVLETLRQGSMIESTESSNRLEGITAPHERIAELVAKRTEPRNRPEQEIAGYRDALSLIHASHERLPFNVGTVLALHGDIHRFSPAGGGAWKAKDNEITETLPDGRKVLRFKPVSAEGTPWAMEALHREFDAIWDAGAVEPLLVIPAYVLDFLCIHPFLDGNGRTARLLTLLLLYKAGYEVGRFISLEQIVERTRTRTMIPCSPPRRAGTSTGTISRPGRNTSLESFSSARIGNLPAGSAPSPPRAAPSAR